MFFTVLWRGLCQAVGWFFGLFGYKRDGLYATCVWRLFAASATIIVTVIAVMLVWEIGETFYEKRYKETHCFDPDCRHAEYIGENIYYHNRCDGEGYIFNSLTGDKTIRNIKWIARSEENDSLICFNDGKKRGYFSKYTGEVVIEPKYSHAWVFSEGLACVDDNGSISFIDSQGKTVIDHVTAYVPGMSGLFFHGGYCVVSKSDEDLYGLMDKTGKYVLPNEYNYIGTNYSQDLWRIRKGDEMAVLDKELKPVIPSMECYVDFDDDMITMTLPNHTIRKYDLKGNLINDFYYTNVRMLEYEKDEIVYRQNVVNKEDDEITEILDEYYHPKATARLRSYMAADGYEGLMNADGYIVTMPLYQDITAIGHDLYMCEVSNGDKVIVNGKGELVKKRVKSLENSE